MNSSAIIDSFFFTSSLSNVNFLNSFWQTLFTNFSEFDLVFKLTWIISFFWFWIPCLIFLYIDLYKPPFLYKYKIQPFKSPDSKLILKGIALVVFNQIFVTGTMTYFAYNILKYRGWVLSSQLPSIAEVVRDLLVFVFWEEVGFYYSHRLAHHPRLYKHIHKIHHQFQAPIALAAQYAHPIEHTFANVLPLMLGPVIMKSHVFTLWVWILLGLWNTLNAHCGYDFPYHRGTTRYHDFHHEKFNYNFGLELGFLDWFHGTDSLYRERYNNPSIWESMFGVRRSISTEKNVKEK